jgi:Mn2+/Fe2+ NRAMP family transporter
VLFTGAAVGVSHLVQSTRAGASYGLSLLLFVLIANVLKYPAFRFGPHYSAATGYSLLEGYRRQGRWALWLYGLFTLGTMFTVQAAVAVVTAGLGAYLLGVDVSPVVLSAVLIVVCAGLLAIGRYQWLDRISKGVVSLLAVSTVMATIIAVATTDWSGVPLWTPLDQLDLEAIFFLAALVGWMPSAIDVAVWQSLWTLARARDSAHWPSLRESMTDFHLGYVGTAFVALCFLVLGAAVMYGKGGEPAAQPMGFAQQLVELYAASLGAWSRPVIAVCAFMTMFSTTLTVVDGFPRALTVLVQRLRSEESPRGTLEQDDQARHVYWSMLVLLAVGAVVVLWLFLSSLPAMVDLATTLSFLTAPVLAWLNHRAVLAPEVPLELRPRPALRAMSWTGIVALGSFAAYYLWLQVV